MIAQINRLAEIMRGQGFRVAFGADMFGAIQMIIVRPNGEPMFIPYVETLKNCLRWLRWAHKHGAMGTAKLA